MILSIDIGITNYGWSIFDKEKLVKSGTLVCSDNNLNYKILQSYNYFKSLIKEYKISSLVYEQPVFINRGINGPSINQCLGVLLLLSAQYSLKLSSYTATEVKKGITGTGKANKKDIMEALSILHPGTTFTSDHEADAIALALYYLHKNFSYTLSV